MSQSSKASNLFNVEGIVAVITGGGSGTSYVPPKPKTQTADRIAIGIGLHMALALAENGAKRVYIMGRRLNVLEQVVKDTVSFAWT